jgi:hypothetical protein
MRNCRLILMFLSCWIVAESSWAQYTLKWSVASSAIMAWAASSPLNAGKSDVNGDGYADIIAHSSSWDSFQVFSGVNGALLWSSPVGYVSPGIANTDADPYPEILVCHYYQTNPQTATFKLLNGQNGAVEWDYSGTVTGQPFLADIDNNGKSEILFLEGGLLKCYGYTGSTGISDNDGSETLPADGLLSQNYPNPFNPSTTIDYSVPRRERVTLQVFNIQGQLVATMLNEDKSAGEYQITWSGKDEAGNQLATGAYFYTLQVGETTYSRKMILLK